MANERVLDIDELEFSTIVGGRWKAVVSDSQPMSDEEFQAWRVRQNSEISIDDVDFAPPQSRHRFKDDLLA